MTDNYVLPRPLDTYLDPAAEREMEFIREYVTWVRRECAERKLNPKDVTVYTVFR
jgi:hypothetical protein